MNFNEAFDLLKSSKCVKRPEWAGYLKLRLNSDATISVFHHIGNSEYRWYEIPFDHIMATDWVEAPPPILPCHLCGNNRVIRVNDNWVRCTICEAEGRLDLWNKAKR